MDLSEEWPGLPFRNDLVEPNGCECGRILLTAGRLVQCNGSLLARQTDNSKAVMNTLLIMKITM